MDRPNTTSPWLLKAPATERPATARLHLDLPEAVHVLSGDVTLQFAPDGSGELRISLAGTPVCIDVAPGESFASVIQRTRDALAQASYPMHDPN